MGFTSSHSNANSFIFICQSLLSKVLSTQIRCKLLLAKKENRNVENFHCFASQIACKLPFNITRSSLLGLAVSSINLGKFNGRMKRKKAKGREKSINYRCQHAMSIVFEILNLFSNSQTRGVARTSGKQDVQRNCVMRELFSASIKSWCLDGQFLRHTPLFARSALLALK